MYTNTFIYECDVYFSSLNMVAISAYTDIRVGASSFFETLFVENIYDIFIGRENRVEWSAKTFLSEQPFLVVGEQQLLAPLPHLSEFEL